VKYLARVKVGSLIAWPPSGDKGGTRFHWLKRFTLGVIFLLSGAVALHAQESWVDNDIGSVGVAGSSSYNSTTDAFTVNGAGTGIGSTADSCHLLSEAVNGCANYHLMGPMVG